MPHPALCIRSLTRERERIYYLSPNYSFQAAWTGQWLFGRLKQLEKNN